MADLDDHDNELVIADFINHSVDSQPDSIPFLRRELYATLSARIITQRFNQDKRGLTPFRFFRFSREVRSNDKLGLAPCTWEGEHRAGRYSGN